MFGIVKGWSQRYFSQPEAAILLLLVLATGLVIAFFGKILAPLLAGLVLAYLLEAVIGPLQRHVRLPRWLAVSLVFAVFIGAFVTVLVWLLPLLSKQFAQLLSDVPAIIQSFHDYLKALPQTYPKYVSARAINDLIQSTNINADRLANVGKSLFSVSLATIPAVMTWLIYILLVPLLALFFLKDKRQLIQWSRQFSPRDNGLVLSVWRDMQKQLGNYVRGKVLEVIIVGVISYIGFIVFQLQYSLLLAVLVGLSVIIPYVGMVIVTIPVMVVGLLQFGATTTFFWMFLIYLIIQALDGNVLVPILFSEAVNLHPIAIIAAVLFFGGLWGFWGLFFAIPLATLVKSLINAWQSHAVV